MILYRISKERHASDLSGRGAEIAGGRWNRKAYPAVYLAENISLAILESIVHCRHINDLYNRLILSIEVPESSIKMLEPAAFPDDWNTTPWSDFTIKTGTSWLESQETLLLKVPSSIVLQENIYILNPRHKKNKDIKIVNTAVFKPDNRLVLLKS
jgi:RES domain-containing protein